MYPVADEGCSPSERDGHAAVVIAVSPISSSLIESSFATPEGDSMKRWVSGWPMLRWIELTATLMKTMGEALREVFPRMSAGISDESAYRHEAAGARTSSVDS